MARCHYHHHRDNVDESNPPSADNRILPRHASVRFQSAMPFQDSTYPICCASVMAAVRSVVFSADSIIHNNSPTVHGHCSRRDPTTWKTLHHSRFIPAIRIYIIRVHFSIQHKIWLHKYLKKCIRASRSMRHFGSALGFNIACLATPKLISTTSKSTTK
ncbi:hypothetical protein ALC62_08926 [Cyphomyrmex costatus]|uniref:Uncharacterized protein n=1 Tax=Cyphomyrmex costatus TaxID=456900 RepID=A0A151IGD1_9HYME|nr:hypothetical protein ALC62_08926 [Cyphomyrmex costatus]